MIRREKKSSGGKMWRRKTRCKMEKKQQETIKRMKQIKKKENEEKRTRETRKRIKQKKKLKR